MRREHSPRCGQLVTCAMLVLRQASRIVRNHFVVPVLSALILHASHAEHAESLAARGLAQREQADAILYYHWADRLYFEKPDLRLDPFPLSALPERTAAATKQRTMILVVMSKAARMLSDEKLKRVVDDLDARLRNTGFKRVIFHLASGTYPTPIYRE